MPVFYVQSRQSFSLFKTSFVLCCDSVFFFRITTPLSMDMFAWTRKEAVLYNGIILCCIGFVSILVFLAVKVAALRYHPSHCAYKLHQKKNRLS